MNIRQRCCVFKFCIFIFLFFSFIKPGGFTGSAVFAAPVLKNVVSAQESYLISEMEKGSPAALKNVVNKVRLSGKEMTVTEQQYLVLATFVLKTVYPAERINWDIPEVSSAGSKYLSIMESVKMGAYAFNLVDSTDFLSLVLPSLVLFTAPNLKNFYADAQTSLVQACKMNQASVLAPYLLGVLYTRQGKNAAAVEYLERAFTLQSDCAVFGEAYAEVLLAQKRPNDAYNAAVKVLLKNNGNIHALILCAESAFEQRNFDLAENYITQVLQSDPSNATCQLMRARILIEKGEYLKAQAALDSFSKTEKVNKDYYVVRLYLLRDWNKNIHAAAMTATQALKEYPEDQELLLLAADIASSAGRKINDMTASQLSSKVLGNDPSNADALKIMVKEAIKNEQWQTAYDRSNKLIQVRNNETAKLLRIEVCLGLNKISEAQSLIKELYDSSPETEDVQVMYVRVLIASKNVSEASALIEKMLPKASQRAKSSLYYQRSKIASTASVKLNDLRSSLASNPRNDQALYELYKIYFDQKDYKKAQYYLKQVIAIKPFDEKLLNHQLELEKLLAQ
ncbi:MAG: tetratricopeptide repeat protein [Treponemataceae bacterium]|nr:tetratricopeptide repeat protein [Treponemataceae bacterium]